MTPRVASVPRAVPVSVTVSIQVRSVWSIQKSSKMWNVSTSHRLAVKRFRFDMAYSPSRGAGADLDGVQVAREGLQVAGRRHLLRLALLHVLGRGAVAGGGGARPGRGAVAGLRLPLGDEFLAFGLAEGQEG